MKDKAFEYDIFLSYNSIDKRTVASFAKKLRALGVTPFLDQWYLITGKQWQHGLDNALKKTRCFAIILSENNTSPWMSNEVQSALNIQTEETRNREYEDLERHVIPVLLPGNYEPDFPPFIDNNTWVDFRNTTLDDIDKLRKLLSGIFNIPPIDINLGTSSPVDIDLSGEENTQDALPRPRRQNRKITSFDIAQERYLKRFKI